MVLNCNQGRGGHHGRRQAGHSGRPAFRRGRRGRSRHRRRGDQHLPGPGGHGERFPRHPSRQVPVQPPRESHRGRLREEARRHGRNGGGAGRVERNGRDRLRPGTDAARGGAYRLLPHHLRRDVRPVHEHLPPARDPGDLRRSGRRFRVRTGHGTGRERPVRGNDEQPAPGDRRPEGAGAAGEGAGRPARRGQHLHPRPGHPVPLRRGRGRLFLHQVHLQIERPDRGSDRRAGRSSSRSSSTSITASSC